MSERAIARCNATQSPRFAGTGHLGTISRGGGSKWSPWVILRNILRQTAALCAQVRAQAVSFAAIHTCLDNLTAHQRTNRREAAIMTEISLWVDASRVHHDCWTRVESLSGPASVGVDQGLYNPHPLLRAGPQIRIAAAGSISRSCCFEVLPQLRRHQEPGVGRLLPPPPTPTLFPATLRLARKTGVAGRSQDCAISHSGACRLLTGGCNSAPNLRGVRRFILQSRCRTMIQDNRVSSARFDARYKMLKSGS